jgi:hypothetical protein
VSNFLHNLVLRGAGIASAVAAQPDAAPLFATYLPDAQTEQPENVPVDETPPEIPALSGAVAPPTPQTPLVERPGPQLGAQLSPSQVRPDIATAHERKPWPDELNRPIPKPEPISDPERTLEPAYAPEPISDPEWVPQPASTPLSPHSEDTLSTRLTVRPEVGAESAGLPTPNRVVPRIQEVARLEAAPHYGQPDAPVSVAAPSGRSSGSRAQPVTWPTLAEPVGSSQPSPGALGENEIGPVVIPAVIQSAAAVSEPPRRSLATTPSEEPGVTPSASQPVQVRIGTIEVRATTPPNVPQQVPRSAQGSGGFDDYAMIRSYTGWERPRG